MYMLHLLMQNSNVGISRTSASVLAQHEISFLLVAHCLGPYIGSYTPCNRNLVFSLTYPWKASYILHRLYILLTNVPILIHVPWLKIVSFSRSVSRRGYTVSSSWMPYSSTM